MSDPTPHLHTRACVDAVAGGRSQYIGTALNIGCPAQFEAGLARHAASGAPNPFERDDDPCAFGDPYCPCQDGDACHYVDVPGSPAMTPPGEERDSERALARAMAEAWGRSDPEDQDDIWLFCARIALSQAGGSADDV